MATIHDVAAKAGVSVKTVSRVLNDYPHISAKMRQKVENAMGELSYTPSLIARQMRLGDTLSIGLLYGDPSSGYQSSLNQAFMEACFSESRYLITELLREDDSDWQNQVERFLDKTRVKNMVLVPPLCDSAEVHQFLRSREVKFILISPSQTFPSTVSIVIDDQRAAAEITNHLIAQGHERIAHLTGNPMHVASLLRQKGYEKALRDAKFRVRQSFVKLGGFNYKLALQCAQELLSLPPNERPTAIFCANDEMAAATMVVAYKLGLSVPDQLAIAGFDDSFVAKMVWPPLTSIAQPFYRIAEEAIRQLKNFPLAAGFDPIVRVLPHELFIRELTTKIL